MDPPETRAQLHEITASIISPFEQNCLGLDNSRVLWQREFGTSTGLRRRARRDARSCDGQTRSTNRGAPGYCTLSANEKRFLA
jgi:hypothetical protein